MKEKMTWKNVALVGLLLAAGVALIEFDQATLAGGVVASAISIAALLTNPKKTDADPESK